MSAGLPCAIAEHLLAEMPFFGPGDVLAADAGASWAEALHRPERLAALGRRARALAEEKFSFAAMAASYEALYRETLEARQVRWVVAYRAENLAQESAWMLHGRFMNDPAVRRLAHFPDFVGTRLARGDRVPHWLRLRAAADDLRLYEFTP